MKKLIALFLALSLLFSGCGNAPEAPTAEPTTEATAAPTEEPTTEPTTVPTTEPPVYTNPLNGETSYEPFTNRIFATTISNIRDALPHVSVNEADILMEMFVNASVVRCIALFSDISDVDAIGSIRSTRPMFNDICEHYNAILAHAGGTGTALRNADEHGITHYNVDSLMRKTDDPLKVATAYRDKEYKYGEHNLFAVGPGLVAYAESEGETVTGQIPAAGQTVPGGSQVIVYLGEDVPERTVEIPDFSGMNRQQASDAAGKLGLYIYIVGNSEISARVVATAQSVPAGELVPVGTTIQLEFTDTGARD